MHPHLQRRLVACLGLSILLLTGTAFANTALQFDGRDYLLAPDSPSLNPSDAITIEAWCQIPRAFTDLGNCPLIEKPYVSHRSPWYQYHMGINSVSREFLFDLALDGERTSLRSPIGALALGPWVHVAGTYDGATMRLYVDGVEVSSRPATGSLSRFDTDVFIGRYGNFVDGIEGMIDEVRVWSVARTPAQIRDAMCGGLGGDEPGLVACWDFEEGEGQVAADLSPFGNDARLGELSVADPLDPVWTAAAIPACPDVAVEVEIDVKPGSDTNRIACGSTASGVVPVAVLTTETFDALAIDHATVRFGPGEAAEAHVNPHGVVRHEEDVDGDGDLDLVFHFRAAEAAFACGDTKAELTGRTFAGAEIHGSDRIDASWRGGEKIGASVRAGIAPNPFNPQTTVSFAVGETQHVRIEVFDLRGRRIAELADRVYAAGEHEVVWDGRGSDGRAAPSGQYFFRIRAGHDTLIRSAIMLK